MRWIFVLLVLPLSFAFAKGDFEERKANRLEAIDARIQAMTEAKSCISAATDRPSMKACGKARKAKMKEIKAKYRKGKPE